MERDRKKRPSRGFIGRVIDQRYRIVRPLGEGAMGTVFVAEHLTLPKQVALKVVRSELSGNRELSARFAREAMAGSKIDHPNIVATLDYGPLDDGGAYLVMPLVPGRRLTDVLDAAGPVPWPRAVEIGVQIADALAAAWAQGFVHRDLKPDNILLEERAVEGPLVRILDFGVAKLSERSSGVEAGSEGGREQLTKEGTIIGTPGYMAPEQALGRSATQVSDLYSLGVILWEAIVGEPMWLGDSAHAIMRAQLRGARPSLAEARPNVALPAALDRLVQRLVSVRPELRPGSAAEVRDALRAIADAGLEAAPAPSRVSPSPLPATVAGPPQPERKGMTPAMAALFGVAGALLLLGALLVLGPLELSVQSRDGAAPGIDGRGEQSAAEVSAALEALLHAPTAEARRASARALLEHADDGAVSGAALTLARLELASTCAQKKEMLAALPHPLGAELRPALLRLSKQPKTGCGARKDQDCLSCLRRDLGALLEAR